MTNQALAVRDDMPLNELGTILAKSGFFTDVRDAGQAIIKVLAGREIGLSPIAAMTGIYIVKGRVTLSANIMAAVLKRSGKYNYRVIEHTEKVCEIAFFEGKEEVGRSRFTLDDARKAGTQNMDKFPRNMLFARAMSNGVKWYAPDVFSSPTYTPDELGATVDADGDVIEQPTPGTAAAVVAASGLTGDDAEELASIAEQLDAEHATEAAAVKTKANGKGLPTRPIIPENLRAMIGKKAARYGAAVATTQQRGLLAGMLEQCFAPAPDAEQRRRAVTIYLAERASLKEEDGMPGADVLALLDWIAPVKDNGGAWAPSDMAAKEAGLVYRAALAEAGQQELALEAEAG